MTILNTEMKIKILNYMGKTPSFGLNTQMEKAKIISVQFVLQNIW